VTPSSAAESRVAFLRRRAVSYLLIAVAFSTFLGKMAIGIAHLTGRMGVGPHHLVEHSLDIVMMGLVLAAVYYARSNEMGRPGSD
jgi:hypothetical protein